MPGEITSDNLHLSETIRLDQTKNCSDVCNPPTAIDCPDPAVLRFVQAATAANTRRAYHSDLEHFLAWGGCLPATDQMVARYLADHAGLLAVSTLARRLVAIRSAHKSRGLPDPSASELVRLTLRGIRREYGGPQRQVAALTAVDLLTITCMLGNSTKDVRDAAILLVGFAGAFRRSELSAIDRKDVDIRPAAMTITIRRSKTDQERRGRKVAIPRSAGPTCPVAVLERWLALSGIDEGLIFRRLTKVGRVLQKGISAEALALIIKQRVAQIGKDASEYSGHSLRAGFVTNAVAAGVPTWRIKTHTGHCSDSALERYVRCATSHDGEVSLELLAQFR
jgi:integrase